MVGEVENRKFHDPNDGYLLIVVMVLRRMMTIIGEGFRLVRVLRQSFSLFSQCWKVYQDQRKGS